MRGNSRDLNLRRLTGTEHLCLVSRDGPARLSLLILGHWQWTLHKRMQTMHPYAMESKAANGLRPAWTTVEAPRYAGPVPSSVISVVTIFFRAAFAL
mgnify:CR=1 FL=1